MSEFEIPAEISGQGYPAPKQTVSVEADEVVEDRGRSGTRDRYRFTYRASNEADARKALAHDEATLEPGHLKAYGARWSPRGRSGQGELTVIFDYFDDLGTKPPPWKLRSA